MKQLVVAPCQTVIQDPESGHSLISVFHGIKVRIPENAPDPPRDAVIPKEWSIFSKFALEPTEEGEDYALSTDIFWPDGTPFVSNTLAATQPTKKDLCFVVKLQGFPIGQSGIVRVDQTLKSRGKTVCGPINLEIEMQLEKTITQAELAQ
jgi:hypothetical protein